MKLIKNALLPDYDKNELVKSDILYDDKIIEIAPKIKTTLTNEVLDLKEKMLLPGVIDAHVHFNDPGYNEHEDFYTGTMAAAFGGVTTIIDMPCTSVPPVTNVENFYKKLNVVSKKALVDFAFWGGIRGNDFPFDYEMIVRLWNEGVVGFKIYTISGMDTFKELSYEQIKKLFVNLPKDILFAFHAEDKDIIDKALQSFSEKELRKVDTYIKTRPIEAEFKAVSNILNSVENNKIHFVHISSQKSAKAIIDAKKKGIDVSFETCPHYLEFTQKDLMTLRGRLKTAPVVKYENDKDFLRMILKNGELDFVTTDHAGCDFEKEKKFDDFSKVYNGIPGTEFFVPYIISEFYLKEKISINGLVNILSKNQAKRYGLYPHKGSLDIGTDADFTIIDTRNKFYADEKKLHSKGKYSPFNGRIFSCSVFGTIVRGNIVVMDSKLIGDRGYGKLVRRDKKID